MTRIAVLLLLVTTTFCQKITLGSVIAELNVGFGSQWGDLASEEKFIIDTYEITRAFENKETGEIVAVPLDYMYTRRFGEISILYAFKPRIAVGAEYQRSSIFQHVDYPDKYSNYETGQPYIEQHFLGPKLSLQVIATHSVSVTASSSAYVVRGELYRMSALEDEYHYQDDFRTLINLLDETVTLEGYGFNISGTFTLAKSFGYFFFKADYNQSYVNLVNDKIDGYIRNSLNKSNGLSFGIAKVFG